jgi:hypothetical protein
MNKKTAVQKIYAMLDEGKVSDLAEMKEWFLNEEKQQMKDCYANGMQVGTGNAVSSFDLHYITTFTQ